MSDKSKTKKAPAKKDTKVVLRTSDRQLPCQLSQTELLAKGDEVSKTDAKLSELRVKKKTTTDELTSEIKGLEGAMKQMHQQIRTRSETREVRCEDIADFKNGIVRTIRTDTGKIVETRALLSHERQPGLPGLTPIDGGKKDDKPLKPSEAKKAAKKKDDAPAAEAPATTA